MIRLRLDGAGRGVALLACGILVLVMQPARAQSSGQSLSVDQIRACMCEKDTLDRLRQGLVRKQAAYDDRNRQIQHLSQQIDQIQATMDPSDASAQDQVDELIALRARVEQKLIEEDLPNLQKATLDLNNEVADYNAKCANRPMFDTDVKAAKQDLVCPKP